MHEIIHMSEPGLFRVNTTTQSHIVYVKSDEKENILLDLCRAIVKIERSGDIVTSVQELSEDGRHPRVAFRNTKEYRKAKQEPEVEIIDGTFVSFWTSGTEFHASCKINALTHEVTDIGYAGVPAEDDVLEGEGIKIGELDAPVYDLDAFIELESEPEELLKSLKQIQSNFWYSGTGRNLEKEIKECEKLLYAEKKDSCEGS